MIVLILVLIFCGTASATERHVYPGGSIQAVINGSSADDVVVVHDNIGSQYTYQENVVINKKNLTVKASGNVSVNAANASNNVFTINKEGNYSTIQGFTITGSTYSGIFLSTGTTGCTLSKNYITNNNDGIFINGASSLIITGNNVYKNTETGIYIYCSDGNNTISGNIVTNNGEFGIGLVACPNSSLSGNAVTNNGGYGIVLSESPETVLRNNIISNNQGWNFKLDYGSSVSDYYQNIDPSNTVNGKPIYYLVGKNNLILNGISVGYLALISCQNITIKNITVSNNEEGILLINTNKSTIADCTLKNNDGGIVLRKDSTNNLIKGNTITSNQGETYNSGVYQSYTSGYNTITGNTILKNGCGIMSDSPSNTINLNNISNNTGNAISMYDGDNNITGNTITYNGNGIYLFGGDSTVNGNTISNNKGNGVYIDMSYGNTLLNNIITYNGLNGIHIYISYTYMHFNQIYGNIGYALSCVSTTPSNIMIEAENNWWGSNSNPSTQISVPSIVAYTPWIIDEVPTVTITDPVNNAVNVARDKVIKVTFNEPIKAGNLWIELYNGNTQIPITKTINGNTLTITHTTQLAANTKYTLCLHTGSVLDLMGTPLSLVARVFTTTTDTIAPSISSIDPINNAANVARDKVIKVTFNEPIKAGNLWIELYNGNTQIPITKTINGNILTITHTALLAANTKYTLCLHTGSILDLAGNPLALAGSVFTTSADTVGPVMVSSDPVINTINVPRNKTIKITFNEPIKTGNLWIELYNGTTQIPINLSISGNILTITHTALLAANTKYTLSLHTGSIVDLAGNPLALFTRVFTTGNT